jgi:methylenetetrahydrofolate dehydrogenase (NADP+)/methenyltetrahydrofolate cyclohydrolase
MMILDGKKCSEQRLEILKEEIGESGLYPQLATLLVGDDPGSQMYVRMKHRACEQVGIGSVGLTLPATATTPQVLERIDCLNRDGDIHGILIQLPLPRQVDKDRVIEAVEPGKDVDGFHPYNLGRLFSGRPAFVPCTPGGILTLLEMYHIPIAGMHAVIVGRSIEVGRPMAALLLARDATVTICHSRTKDLDRHLRSADILVSAVGKARFIGPEQVRPGATVIDVGINHVNGKLCGDVDFDRVRDVAGAITPVPGGVGPMTIATLMENAFRAAMSRSCNGVQ